MNWPDYDRGLVRRGDIRFWIDESALEQWDAAKRRTPGGQRRFSELAISTTLNRSGFGGGSDRGSQYVSIKYTERLAEAGIEPSVSSVGDSYDNALAETALAETVNGLYKGAYKKRLTWPASWPNLLPRNAKEVSIMDFGSKFGHFLLFVLLTIITLGLYLLWFQVTMTQERNKLLKEIRDSLKGR